jgi:hypothetical protein
MACASIKRARLLHILDRRSPTSDDERLPGPISATAALMRSRQKFDSVDRRLAKRDESFDDLCQNLAVAERAISQLRLHRVLIMQVWQGRTRQRIVGMAHVPMPFGN